MFYSSSKVGETAMMLVYDRKIQESGKNAIKRFRRFNAHLSLCHSNVKYIHL